MKPENLDQTKTEIENKIAPLSDGSLINVNISDILTPVTCALLINEILQGLLYQKCQIPYPYSWLKAVVDKKRGISSSEETVKKINFSAAHHFRIVSTAYDTLEKIMKGIVKEFSEKSDLIKEVIVIFGTTPVCPKEIYTINISSLARGHLEKNHASPICNYRQRILRNIFLSQNWLDAVDNSMACTNTYVFLKTFVAHGECSTAVSGDNIFLPSRPLTLSPRAKHIRINLNYDVSDKRDCCDNFFVFEDAGEGDVKQEQTNESSNTSHQTVNWYQCKDLFKGFRDCYINKVSASELW